MIKKTDAAAMLGLGERQLDRLRKADRIKGHKVGRCVMFNVADIVTLRCSRESDRKKDA